MLFFIWEEYIYAASRTWPPNKAKHKNNRFKHWPRVYITQQIQKKVSDVPNWRRLTKIAIGIFEKLLGWKVFNWFKYNARDTYLFVTKLWFCHLHVISSLTLSSITSYGGWMEKLNKLDWTRWWLDDVFLERNHPCLHYAKTTSTTFLQWLRKNESSLRQYFFSISKHWQTAKTTFLQGNEECLSFLESFWFRNNRNMS